MTGHTAAIIFPPPPHSVLSIYLGVGWGALGLQTSAGRIHVGKGVAIMFPIQETWQRARGACRDKKKSGGKSLCQDVCFHPTPPHPPPFHSDFIVYLQFEEGEVVSGGWGGLLISVKCAMQDFLERGSDA